MLKDVGILGGLVVSFMLYLFFQGTLAPFFEADSNAPRIISLLIGIATLATIGTFTKFAIGHWLLFVLFITHALVGAVELGTDGWIQNITGAILSEEEGKILFVFTSLMMFLLRFCAHFIEKKVGLNPISLLFVCAVLACIGLNLVSAVTAFGPALGALLVYALGKTFFWPTMLAVVGDRFPATGAVAMSLMGGIGMMSAGLIGSPGLGYFKDRYAAEELKKADTELFTEWKDAEKKSAFLQFDTVEPIDGKRLEAAKKTSVDDRTEAEATVVAADIEGNRRTLKVDSLIPATMAVIFLLLMLYFKATGGYKVVSIDDE